MKQALFVACLLLGGCSLFGGEDYDIRSAHATSVEFAGTDSEVVIIEYVGWLSSACWDFYRTAIEREGTILTVDLRYYYTSTGCHDGIDIVERELTLRVPGPGTYTFRFPSGPEETLDLEVVVP